MKHDDLTTKFNPLKLFKEWRRDDQQNQVIKTLWIIIGIQVAVIFLVCSGWRSAPDHLRIYIPPNVDRGVWIKPGEIPDSTVYAFTYQIFTAINSWTNGSNIDYEKNIKSYRNYLSDQFYQELLSDESGRSETGSLDRKRIMSGVSGSSFKLSDVKNLGDGTWQVNMQLHIVETVDASVVKDVVMNYSFYVSKVNTSIQVNQWGLVISGFAQEPSRVKTTI